MIEDLVKIKDKVEYILKSHPATRDSDKLLWLAYLCLHHDLRQELSRSSDPYETLKSIVMSEKTPTMESVRRVRQKHQENGKYLGLRRKQRLAEAEMVSEWVAGNEV